MVCYRSLFGFKYAANILLMHACMTIAFLAPGVIDDIRAGEIIDMQIGPELLVIMAVMYYWIPLVMAVLSVTLKDSINRWANTIAGVGYAGFVLIELISNITTVAYPYAMLMDVSAIVAAALIAWYAWKWPKEESSLTYCYDCPFFGDIWNNQEETTCTCSLIYSRQNQTEYAHICILSVVSSTFFLAMSNDTTNVDARIQNRT